MTDAFWSRQPQKPAPSALQRLDRTQSFLADDAFLKPVIEDDPILRKLTIPAYNPPNPAPTDAFAPPPAEIDFDELLEARTGAAPAASSSGPVATTPGSGSDDRDLVSILRAQLADTQLAFSSLKKVVQDRLGDSLGLDLVQEVQQDTAEVPKPKVRKEGELPKDSKGKERDDDSHYFESYAYNEIHEIMLKGKPYAFPVPQVYFRAGLTVALIGGLDRVRTNAYRDFILGNPSIFKDAVVLDVGCGTGVLSMFAARSGAKKVYAVDASAIAFKAERNIKANGLSDVITVVKGKVENIEIPEKVDVIVSEWMGYFLLYECMLDSVLHARERFMKPTGLMVPSQCSILLSLMDGGRMMDDRVKFWDDVYGFDMTAMKEEIADDAMIDVMAHSEVVSDFATLSVSTHPAPPHPSCEACLLTIPFSSTCAGHRHTDSHRPRALIHDALHPHGLHLNHRPRFPRPLRHLLHHRRPRGPVGRHGRADQHGPARRARPDRGLLHGGHAGHADALEADGLHPARADRGPGRGQGRGRVQVWQEPGQFARAGVRGDVGCRQGGRQGRQGGGAGVEGQVGRVEVESGLGVQRCLDVLWTF